MYLEAKQTTLRWTFNDSPNNLLVYWFKVGGQTQQGLVEAARSDWDFEFTHTASTPADRTFRENWRVKTVTGFTRGVLLSVDRSNVVLHSPHWRLMESDLLEEEWPLCPQLHTETRDQGLTRGQRSAMMWLDPCVINGQANALNGFEQLWQRRKTIGEKKGIRQREQKPNNKQNKKLLKILN